MAANEPGQPPIALGAPVTVELDVPRVAMAVAAHPDDVEFGAGGTLAKWARDGCLIHHVICTDGSKGTWDVDADLDALVQRRQAEQREAARLIGGDHAGEVIFLGRTDGDLANDVGTHAEIIRLIRVLRPEVVLTHDPWKRYRLHPDHRHAGELVGDAIVAARDPHFYPGLGGPAHRPSTLLLWEADEVHHVEDVTGTIDIKIAALLAHVSQHETTMGGTDTAQLELFAQRQYDRAATLGAPYGLAAAEVFARISDL